MNRQTLGCVLVLGSILWAGCGTSASSSSAPTGAGIKASSVPMTTPAGSSDGTNPPGAAVVAGPIGGGGQFQPPAFLPDTPTTNPAGDPGETPPTEAVAAQVGVGSKGRSLDQHEGIIVTPAKTLFAAKERIAFEIAIPHALNLFKAMNGDAPKSHDEFMQKIVVENNIKLPQLPAGHHYLYDPTTEQLMVQRPKK